MSTLGCFRSFSHAVFTRDSAAGNAKTLLKEAADTEVARRTLIYVKAPTVERPHEKARAMSAIPTDQKGRRGVPGRPAAPRERA